MPPATTPDVGLAVASTPAASSPPPMVAFCASHVSSLRRLKALKEMVASWAGQAHGIPLHVSVSSVVDVAPVTHRAIERLLAEHGGLRVTYTGAVVRSDVVRTSSDPGRSDVEGAGVVSLAAAGPPRASVCGTPASSVALSCPARQPIDVAASSRDAATLRSAAAHLAKANITYAIAYDHSAPCPHERTTCVAADAGDVDGRGSVLQLRGRVHYLEDPLRPGEGGLDGVVEVG